MSNARRPASHAREHYRRDPPPFALLHTTFKQPSRHEKEKRKKKTKKKVGNLSGKQIETTGHIEQLLAAAAAQTKFARGGEIFGSRAPVEHASAITRAHAAAWDASRRVETRTKPYLDRSAFREKRGASTAPVPVSLSRPRSGMAHDAPRVLCRATCRQDVRTRRAPLSGRGEPVLGAFLSTSPSSGRDYYHSAPRLPGTCHGYPCRRPDVPSPVRRQPPAPPLRPLAPTPPSP